ncbi:DUF6527 family protein [Flavobacterium sp. ASV13]|uniref:DUF6527 family protein n=1 Tax=Flavobacterium sp. ASV13 TaxID=1506583 RepID=UPI001930EB0C|nr:DUF6527 family protein [Flavobacterium sp. ASV13]
MLLQYRFIEFIPEKVEEGILYISIEYCTAIHKCICGCGNEVVTPFSPTDWKLSFNGKSVSLHPSIGNWNFECQSHYWIKNNKIEFASLWTEKEIRVGRENDMDRKMDYFEGQNMVVKKEPLIQEIPKPSIWKKISMFFRL